MLFAPHSGWTNDLIINSALFYNRAVEFPKMMPGRHSSCSVSDAWFESVTYRESVTTREIADRMRVLQNDGELVQLDTPAGPFWIPARDRPTLPEMLAEQQRDVYGTGEHDVHPGDVVLDCGANVGVFTRRALKRGAKLVVAIEPSPSVLESLRRNLRDEIATGRVIVYPKGVWNKDSTLELTTNSALASTANSVAIDRGGHGPTVPLTTIDAIVRELSLSKVDFIKMDIEGSEGPALEGGAATIARFEPRMSIALEHRQADLESLTDQVHRYWPELSISYGRCVRVLDRVQPDVMFVR